MIDIPDVIFEPRALAEQAVLAIAERAAMLAAERAAEAAALRAADHTAEMVVSRIFLHVGIDITDKVAMANFREQLQFLARMERGTREVRSMAVKTCVGAFVTGLITLLVIGFTNWIPHH